MMSGKLLLAVVVVVVAQQIGVAEAGKAGHEDVERWGFTSLVLNWAMSWGEWGKKEFCPENTFAYAFRLKMESEKAYDDTSLNAIELFCRNPRDVGKGKAHPKKKAKEHRITSTEGKFGLWKGKKVCKKGLLTSFRMKSEKDQGPGDDTAANDLEMRCDHSTQTLNGGGNHWGNFSDWASCRAGWAICGLQTRVEGDVAGDDTALNDVKMFCCKLGIERE